MPWSTEQGRETSPLNFKICRWPVTSYIETVDFRLLGTRSGKGRLYRDPLAGEAFSSQRRQVFSVPEFWSQARWTLNSARGFSDRSDRSARLPKVESWSRRICLCEEGTQLGPWRWLGECSRPSWPSCTLQKRGAMISKSHWSQSHKFVLDVLGLSTALSGSVGSLEIWHSKLHSVQTTLSAIYAVSLPSWALILLHPNPWRTTEVGFLLDLPSPTEIAFQLFKPETFAGCVWKWSIHPVIAC